AVRVDHPQVRFVLVVHHVAELPHVDDALAVGRNLRIDRILQVEDVDRSQPVGPFLALVFFLVLSQGRNDTHKQHEDSESPTKSETHGELLWLGWKSREVYRREVVTTKCRRPLRNL